MSPYRDPLHTLRKSCINDWARRHPPQVVMDWAGHRSIKTTLTYYTQAEERDRQEAAKRPMFDESDTIRDTNRADHRVDGSAGSAETVVA